MKTSARLARKWAAIRTSALCNSAARGNWFSCNHSLPSMQYGSRRRASGNISTLSFHLTEVCQNGICYPRLWSTFFPRMLRANTERPSLGGQHTQRTRATVSGNAPEMVMHTQTGFHRVLFLFKDSLTLHNIPSRRDVCLCPSLGGGANRILIRRLILACDRFREVTFWNEGTKIKLFAYLH